MHLPSSTTHMAVTARPFSPHLNQSMSYQKDRLRSSQKIMQVCDIYENIAELDKWGAMLVLPN